MINRLNHFSVCLLAATILIPAACGAQPKDAAPASSTAATAKANPTMATVDGIAITENDLGIKPELLKIEQQLFELRSRAVENAVAKKLLEREAEANGKTFEAYLEEMVDSKVAEPTDAEIVAFYETQKARMRGQPLEGLKDQIAAFLKNGKLQQARTALVDEIRASHKVEILIDAPRLPVNIEGTPLRGPAGAPVTIVEFSDFQCPFCKRMQSTIGELREKYPDTVNWRFKDLPLVSIHSGAQYAAEASRCAHDQGKFWEYRDALFEEARVTDEIHPGIAAKLGLDKAAFDACLTSRKYKEAVEADSEEAQSLGITGTPAFIINGILLSGAQPIEEFVRVIDSELKTATAKP
jgi:protein-disulfide isomerase